MKKSTYVGFLIGLVAVLFCEILGFRFTNWQWWVIGFPIIVILNVLHYVCKDDEPKTN